MSNPLCWMDRIGELHGHAFADHLEIIEIIFLLCSWVQMLETEGIIEKFVPVDFSDAETVFDRCLEVSRRTAMHVEQVDRIHPSHLALYLIRPSKRSARKLATSMVSPHSANLQCPLHLVWLKC